MSNSATSVTEKRIADYFVICGLDLSSGLEPDQLAGESLHCTPLDRPYRSKVLAHYPENVPWNPFDKSAVGMLCLPKGLTFRTQKHKRNPYFHSFIITREDGTRTYGQCYTFYEEVSDRKICDAMHTLQAMHLTELSSSKVPGIHHIPDVGSTRSLPRSFKLSGRQSRNNHSGALYDHTRDSLFVTKCICLISQLPVVVAFRKFLEGLHSLVLLREPPPMRLESYVYNILFEVPLPPPNRSLKFMCFGQQVLCQRPGPCELPFFEYSYQSLFSTLGVDNVILLYTSVLLENQVLLFSADYDKLMIIAECITMLLFPFTWQHVYVPILPASLHHFLDAPVPYIMGLCCGIEERAQLSIPGEANLCCVDIDNQIVEVPEDIPKFPCRNELVTELVDTMKTFGVSSNEKGLDRNSNERNSRNHLRKLSWTFDSGDSGVSSSDSSARSSYSSLASTHSHILQQSEALQKVTALAKKTGVITSLGDLEKPKKIDNEGPRSRLKEEFRQFVDMLKLNNAVREIFLNRFIHMFRSYESFVIQPNQHDMEQWLSTRETMQNFDKTAFLSDQPEPHLPFLSRFIETQMFATLIDNKIVSLWEEPDPYLKIYDSRIRLLNGDHCSDGTVRVPNYERCPSYERCITYQDTETHIEKRVSDIDIIAPPPKAIDNDSEISGSNRHIPGYFPLLDSDLLNDDPVGNRSRRRSANAHCKRRDRRHQHAEHLQINSSQREKFIQEARTKTIRNQKHYDVSPASISQTYWKFVVALLKECKMRTKRMLVEKMGQEAVELGHNEISITGVEENTLIASLCDLLERVWAHGLQSKQGKSALWSHLVSYLEVEECKSTGKPIDPNFLTPALAWCVLRKRIDYISNLTLEGDPSPHRKENNKDRKKAKTPDMPALKSLPISLVYDIKNVQAMTEIKTGIGYARAWVRLALEKKLLHKHLQKLLSNQELLRSSYKRYAFLRCEEEKEQFLYHLLTLNAVDYFCFTNTFTSTIMPYRVVVFPSRKLSASTTSANAWIIVAGSLGETKLIPLPRQTLEIVFQHKNLGILTTLRIGHDNTGISPKWMVEHVLVRNEISGHTYKFPCGRWLGKGVDDGSTERLLVGEMVPRDYDTDELMETCRTPPRCRSPSVPRRPKLTVPEIQQMLGDAVNNIVKYYYKSEKERGSLTILLCGEMGLVYCLEQVFLYGFKATRFFRHVYLWDFFVKVKNHFENSLQEDGGLNSPVPRESLEHIVVMRSYCSLVDKIDNASCSVGKDGKFQLFICFAARDHLLHRMLLHIASTSVTSSMYEEQSFLRDPNLVTFLVQILESLSEFTITLETSLTKGIES